MSSVQTKKGKEGESRFEYDELEQKVKERTFELQKANNSLRREIAKRKKREVALRESDERYRVLYEDNPSMYFTLDEDAMIISVNQFGACQLGYKVKELLGKPVISVFHPEDQPKVRYQFKGCLKNPNQVAQWEFRKIRKDGSMMWVEERARAVKKPNGRWKVLIVCEDITQRKRIEQDQQIQKAFLYQVIDANPNLIFVKDSESKFTLVNKAAANNYGAAAEELVGKTDSDFNDNKEQTDQFIRDDREVMVSQKSKLITEELLTETRTGQRRWFQTIKTPLITEGEKPQILGVATDITERKQAEREINKLKDFYGHILDSLPIQIAVLEKTGHYRYVNSGEIKNSKIRKWLIGKTDTEYCRKVTLPQGIGRERTKALRKAVEGKCVNSFEEEFPLKRGRLKYIIRSYIPVVDENSEVQYVISYAQDITENKLAHEALRKNYGLLNAIMEATPDAIFAKDLMGYYVMINSSGAKFIGEKATRIIGKTDSELFDQKTAQNLIKNDQKIIVSDKLHNYEETLHASESAQTFLTTKMPYHDNKGNKLGLLGIARDITQSKETEEALLKAHNELEQRVKERTKELNEANKFLKKEMSFREKMEAALRKSEEKYRTLVNNSLQGMLILQNERIVFVNPTLEEMGGYKKEELLNASLDQLAEMIHPEDQPLVLRRLKDRINGKKSPSHYQYRGIRKDGNIIWLEVYANLIDYNGKPAIQAVYLDITERKKAEEALFISEERYQMAVNAGKVGVWDWDVKTNETYLDPKLKSLLDYENHEIGNQMDDWHKLFHPDDLEKVKKAVSDHLAGRTRNYEIEHKMVCKNGSTKWFIARGNVFRDGLGKPNRMVGTNTDITELKNAEEALRESEDRFSKAFNTTPAAISITNLQDSKFIDVNNRFVELLGYKREELIGQSALDLAIWADPEVRMKLKKYLRKRGFIHGSEAQVRTKTGDIRSVLGSVELIELGNKPCILSMIEDITVRKQSEAKQKQLMDKLNASNRELEEFAYIASHDLKSPLRAIGSLVNWLFTDYQDKFDEHGKEQMKLLRDRTQRMHNFIEGMLQYSRVSRVHENDEQVNLNLLVPNIINNFIYVGNNIRIEIENELPTVTCQRVKIESVFQNLISNAVKYIDKPKGIVRIGCGKENGGYKFYVSDNGMGIDKKHFNKIFQIFQTLHPRDDSESTGIGLSIVRKVVENRKGKVWLDSNKGKGTTFYFTIPNVK